jgi:hypothetical protein
MHAARYMLHPLPDHPLLFAAESSGRTVCCVAGRKLCVVRCLLWQDIMFAAESSGCCERQCLGPTRPFEMSIILLNGTKVRKRAPCNLQLQQTTWSVQMQ